MPTVIVEGRDAFEAPAGKKLVLAIEDAGIDILHRCGGNAACTTCRVEILAGTVPEISEAEIAALEEPALIEKYRLSCQIHVAGDMSVRLWKTASEQGIEPGDRPED
ncbi:MAG: 2Fe-2S iron-sulfur cluster-binding protein [bacterium]